MVETKVVEKGRVRVSSNGCIEVKNNKGEFRAATITYSTVGSKQYPREEGVFSFGDFETGKRIQRTAKKVIADAFIPEIEDGYSIDYKDGNCRNLDVSNLERRTKGQMTEKVKKSLKNTCKICGGDVYSPSNVCVSCTYKKTLAKARVKNAQKKVDKIKKDFSHVDVEQLTEREKEVLELRLQGKTFQAIGEELGFAQQYARQVCKRIEGMGK